MTSPTRRTFIRQAACAALTTSGLLSTILDLRRLSAAPLDTTDYKALICLFLYGGNDANNVIVPRDTSGYASYAAARGALAIPQASLLPLTLQNGDGRDFGFHPNLRELQALFNQGKLGLVANVGTLVAPITRAQYLAGGAAVPPQLFSHSDQSVQWQTSVPDQISKTGWGGRMADRLQSLNAGSKISLSISIAGTNTFEVGNTVLPYIVSPNGSIGLAGFDGSANANIRLQAFKDLLALPHNNLFEQAYSDTVSRSIAANELLTSALAGAPAFQTPFPTTNLGSQLNMIAKLIGARTNLSMQRQIFFCSVGGYDTHGDQLTGQANLLTELSQALNAFYAATVELGVAQQVTTFTASDFGRTFPTNGTGSDHGWGSHQFVLGGAVQGGRLFGTFPTLAVNGPDDTGQGRWIPTTSVDEFSATLATWFGVSASDLATVLPNIGRFARPNLGIFA
ncbi:MAG TPA: DUF1501 domain-containing protein [Chthoniobacterales bacterium]|jgi:uncharacterized protein (DUF1501 family)|nr:DUF1501 domain-containing protein [Chthoniobacterales bacterium]